MHEKAALSIWIGCLFFGCISSTLAYCHLLQHFEINIATTNVRSEEVAKRLEFMRRPGEIKNAEIVNGKVLNHVVYTCSFDQCQ